MGTSTGAACAQGTEARQMTELTYERFRDHVVDRLQLAGPEADPDLSLTADLGTTGSDPGLGWLVRTDS